MSLTVSDMIFLTYMEEFASHIENDFVHAHFVKAIESMRKGNVPRRIPFTNHTTDSIEQMRKRREALDLPFEPYHDR
ncbi:hypothetical protein PP938_gp256 [Rhizobium phage AF3]|uniref:Uncharacterized protein n=1 Tax=Rhizobium phage AF3 TaxID=2763529 RepID=A0A7G7WWH3_9CAUD|nr:hypothetical protein PP938_gp256 [Rhizobium phage AF3]QNH71567.1 hypothetical protein AF3_256 [Rhizobium phage AF3]